MPMQLKPFLLSTLHQQTGECWEGLHDATLALSSPKELALQTNLDLKAEAGIKISPVAD